MSDRIGFYALGREIGRGATAVVREAVHEPTGRRFAIKRPLRAEPETITRLRREARVLRLLDHPNVVRVENFVQDGPDGSYLVLELLEGETLAERFARTGAMLVTEAAALLLPVVSAVGRAHALGVLHRDLKLENVFITSDGTIKVLDFGVAKLGAAQGLAQATSPLTQRGVAVGTPYTMAPEQAFGDEIDHRADVWALGVMAYQCLSGRRPVAGYDLAQVMRILQTGAIAPLRAIAPGVPPDVAEIVSASLKRHPRERPESLHRLRDVLARYAGVGVPDFDEPARSERSSIA